MKSRADYEREDRDRHIDALRAIATQRRGEYFFALRFGTAEQVGDRYTAYQEAQRALVEATDETQ